MASTALDVSATTAAALAPAGDSSLEMQIASLTVTPPAPETGYSRSLFLYWIDADHNGCDTRCEVLARQKRYDLPGLVTGGWLSPYDGYTTDSSAELDVDHAVSLAEAWVSGGDRWDAATREAFANDLVSPELIAVTASTNRSKGSRDPTGWQPPSRGGWCEYVRAWVAVKVRWRLSADEPELTALRNMAAACR